MDEWGSARPGAEPVTREVNAADVIPYWSIEDWRKSRPCTSKLCHFGPLFKNSLLCVEGAQKALKDAKKSQICSCPKGRYLTFFKANTDVFQSHTISEVRSVAFQDMTAEDMKCDKCQEGEVKYCKSCRNTGEIYGRLPSMWLLNELNEEPSDFSLASVDPHKLYREQLTHTKLFDPNGDVISEYPIPETRRRLISPHTPTGNQLIDRLLREEYRASMRSQYTN